MIFKKPQNVLEGNAGNVKQNNKPSGPDTQNECPKCKKILTPQDISENYNVCPYCLYHFKITARKRIEMICDAGSFKEYYQSMRSINVIDFPGYDKKLRTSELTSHENEAVVCGTCRIIGLRCAVFFMESNFMMGSMGSVVGEKITRLFEMATEESIPVIGYTVSGGARMQEGIISLMQMAKVSGAVKRHGDAGNLYVCVLTDPTTGGVTASFAMEADIILAEPYALIGFAGPRVIEQTIRKKLPDEFQTAEFLLDRGFIDNIIERKRQKKFLNTILKLHR